MTVPTPGWLAMRLARYGSPLVLSVLGVALTLENGNASDEEINAYYDRLASTPDTVHMLSKHYVALEEQHPFLVGALNGITGWFEYPPQSSWRQVGQVARTLSDIEWSRTEPDFGHGDLLGRVHNQMNAIGNARTQVFDYVTIGETIRGIFEDIDHLRSVSRMGSFTDAWCGSGTRAIAVHRVRQFLDLPEVPMRLNDPSPIAVAMAGLNMVSNSITTDVTLTCDRAWAEMWGAATFMRVLPLDMDEMRSTPPEELRHAGLRVQKGRKKPPKS